MKKLARFLDQGVWFAVSAPLAIAHEKDAEPGFGKTPLAVSKLARRNGPKRRDVTRS